MQKKMIAVQEVGIRPEAIVVALWNITGQMALHPCYLLQASTLQNGPGNLRARPEMTTLQLSKKIFMNIVCQPETKILEVKNLFKGIGAESQRAIVRALVKAFFQVYAPELKALTGEEKFGIAFASLYAVAEALIVGPLDTRRVLKAIDQSYELKDLYKGCMANMLRQFFVWVSYMEGDRFWTNYVDTSSAEERSLANYTARTLFITGLIFGSTAGLEVLQRNAQIFEKSTKVRPEPLPKTNARSSRVQPRTGYQVVQDIRQHWRTPNTLARQSYYGANVVSTLRNPMARRVALASTLPKAVAMWGLVLLTDAGFEIAKQIRKLRE